MRADPMFRDVTSDSQLRGLQAHAQHRPRQGQPAGRADRGHPHRALHRFRRAPGLDDLHPERHLPGDHAGRRQRPRVEDAFAKIYVRGKAGALVPLSAFATVRAHGRAHRDQSPGPAAGDHDLVQPRARAPRWATPRKNLEGYVRELQDAGHHRHQLRRRRRGVPGFAGGQAILLIVGAPGDLRAAGRAVRELHPPAHDPGRPAVGRGGRAAHAVAVQAWTSR